LGILCFGTGLYADDVAQFEKTVSLPDCDPNNPEVKIISQVADWSAVNRAKFRIFCVQPGDYSAAGDLVIKSSGSKDAQRYLIHIDASNGEDIQPWRQAQHQRAIIKSLTLRKTHHWVVDGLTITDPDDTSDKRLVDVKQSHNNVFNRLLLEHNDAHLYRVTQGSADNTLQNSVLRYTKIENRTEHACVYIAVDDRYGDTVNPHIVSNEIYDCAGDAIQTNSNSKKSPQHGIKGMIIENNDMYITPAMYVDCKTGNRTPNGRCACAENAIDIKIAYVGESPDKESLSRIIGNRMWGYRATNNLPASLGGLCEKTNNKYAPAIDFHFVGADFIHVEGNIITDSENGIWVSRSGPEHLTIVDNLFYDVSNKIHRRDALDLGRAFQVKAENNVKVDASQNILKTTAKGRQDLSNKGLCFQRRRLTKAETLCVPGEAVKGFKQDGYTTSSEND
jgi:hypothetical protein